MAAIGPSPFKVGDNQRPERTMSGAAKIFALVFRPRRSPEPGEGGGINCGGDMGVRRCLARSLTSLALMRTPKSANDPRSNSFQPDSPSTTTYPRGRKTQPALTCLFKSPKSLSIPPCSFQPMKPFLPSQSDPPDSSLLPANSEYSPLSYLS